MTDVEPATSTAPDGAPGSSVPAGGVAFLLLLAAGLVGWIIRRHRSPRPQR